MVTNEVIKQIFNNRDFKNKCIDDISLLLYNDQSTKYFSSNAEECPMDLKTIKGCNKIAEKIIELIFCK